MQKTPWWKAGLGTVLVVLGFILTQIPGGLVSVLPLPAWLALPLRLVLNIGLFTGYVALLARVLDKTRLADYHLDSFFQGWKPLVLGLGVGVLAFGLVVGPLYALGLYQIRWVGDWTSLLAGLVLFISVGYGEELLCRGYIQHKLLRLGPVGALFVTAGLFSALHLFNPHLSLIAMANLLLAGTFMGAAMYATGSLWMAIGIHITWNWVQGSVLGISVSGQEISSLLVTTVSPGRDLLTGGAFGAEASLLCTGVLVAGTGLFLWLARKNGNLEKFRVGKEASL